MSRFGFKFWIHKKQSGGHLIHGVSVYIQSLYSEHKKIDILKDICYFKMFAIVCYQICVRSIYLKKQLRYQSEILYVDILYCD